MATLIDWNAIELKSNSYIGESDYATTQKRAFSHIILEYQLSLSPEEITDSITDGPDDRGVDAVFIDDRSGSNTIHLFQFKHVNTFNKASNNFPSNEIDKILSFCNDLLNQDQNMRQTCNPSLWKKIREIWSALEKPNPSFCIHFCSNTKPMVNTHKERINSSLEEFDVFTVLHHSIDSIVGMFLEKRQSKIDSTLKVIDKNYFDRTDGNIRGFIGTFEAKEIVKLISDPINPGNIRYDIFNNNVRIYLTQKNNVNRKILATALSDKNSEFWYLNNGITMTCDSFSYMPGARNPNIELKNIQIVNGGQTSNALFEAYKQDPGRLADVLVLGRIYETRNRDITSEIAEATNSQTPINTRDLRSNDELQKKLEESFLDQGLFYERKKHQHQQQQNNKRIDALSAGQALLAYSLGYPEVAKANRARVFGDLYETVFNNHLTTERLLVAFNLYKQIHQMKRDLQKQMRTKKPFDTSLMFLIDGGYHVLFATHELCLHKNIDPFDYPKSEKQIKKAVTTIKKLVISEMKSDEGFTTNRFFKDTKTKI